MCVVDYDLQAQHAQLLLVCVQVLHEKPTLVAHWLACAGSVIHDDDEITGTHVEERCSVPIFSVSPVLF
jgi:hypothetical protein